MDIFSNTNTTYDPSREVSDSVASSMAITGVIGTAIFIVACIIRLKETRFFMSKAYFKDE